MNAGAVAVLLVGGALAGLGVGGLVHEAVTRLKPPHQSASGEGLYGLVAGVGVALMVLSSWLRRRGGD